MSKLKIKNGNTWEEIPAGGVGVPSGGTQGQILVKSSGSDYATEWGSNVLETGTSGNWKYTKFRDGTCELFYANDSYSAAMTAQKGNVYTFSSDDEVLYPFDVYDAWGSVDARVSSNVTIPWAGNVRFWQLKVSFRLFNPTSTTSTVALHIGVRGKFVQS